MSSLVYSTSSLHSRDRIVEQKYLRRCGDDSTCTFYSLTVDRDVTSPPTEDPFSSQTVHPSTTCDAVHRRSLCRTCCVTRDSASLTAVSSLSLPSFSRPDSSLSVFPTSTQPYFEIVYSLLLSRPCPAVATICRGCRRRCDAKVPQQTRRFFSRHPVYPVYFVREAHRCVRRVNVRPSPHATDRRASYAPTHRSPVCFGFPGVTRTPHFSPVTWTPLSLSLFPFFLSSLFAHSRVLAISLSLSFLPLSRCAIYPYVRETQRRRGPKMGIESRQPVTSGCVHGTVHREYRYLQTMQRQPLEVYIRYKNIFV